MPRLALKFAYDGKEFFGYARQPKLRTVEGEILRAFDKLKIPSLKFQSASRTDRGVSALGNVLAFNTTFDKKGIIRALNSQVKDIWFYGLKDAPQEFSPRYAAQRWYRYFMLKNNLNLAQMRKAAKLFLGKHNFSSFAKRSERNPIRKIDSFVVRKEAGFLVFDLKAESFLWEQVRRMLSAVEKAGLAELELEAIREALSNYKNLKLAPVQPEPLILMDVKYKFEFELDKRAVIKLKDFWLKKLVNLKARESLFEHLLNL